MPTVNYSVCAEVLLIVAGVAGSIYLFFKLRDKRSSLVLTAEGFLDNGSYNNGAWVSWRDVASVAKHKHTLFSRKPLMSWVAVYMKDPEAYLQRLPDAFWRKKNSVLVQPDM